MTLKRRRSSGIVCVLAALVAFGCDRKAAEDTTSALSDEQILAHFELIALNSEFDGPLDSLKKWESPVFVSVIGTPSDRHLTVLREHLVDVMVLTGLDIEPGEDASDGDSVLAVHFISDEEARRLAGEQPEDDPFAIAEVLDLLLTPDIKDNERCTFAFSWDVDGRILFGDVFIHSDIEAADVTPCVVEELSQVLGLPNDTNQAGPTVFSDNGEFVALTQQDLLFLRMLYDPRLRSGMTLEDVRREAGNILRDIRTEDEVRTIEALRRLAKDELRRIDEG